MKIWKIYFRDEEQELNLLGIYQVYSQALMEIQKMFENGIHPDEITLVKEEA